MFDMPIEEKHFNFLKRCSWYHHVTADFPKICISMVYFLMNDTDLCRSSDDKTAGVMLLVCSIFSLIFGVITHLISHVVDGSANGLIETAPARQLASKAGRGAMRDNVLDDLLVFNTP